MSPEQILTHAVEYCDRRFPKWLPWQIEALQTVLSISMGWGTFRRRMAIAIEVTAADLEHKLNALGYSLIQDIQITATEWLARADKPPIQARAEELLRHAISDVCEHPDEHLSVPMDNVRYCLSCGARLEHVEP